MSALSSWIYSSKREPRLVRFAKFMWSVLILAIIGGAMAFAMRLTWAFGSWVIQ